MGWFSPSYKMLLEVWRSAVQTFKPITTRKNVTERRLEFIGGGVLEFWSLDNPDAARGRAYRRVIVDEAAMVPGLYDIWQAVLRPTLVDHAGDAWFLSTPKGHNGFWQLYQRGIDKQYTDWSAWQMPTASNPHIPPSEIDAMRESMPERVFAQEVMAQFMDDAGGVFRRVMACVGANETDKAIPNHEYVIGVDWGKSNDFTVLTVLDATTRQVVYIDRFNQIDYALQRKRLGALAERFKPGSIVAESNSIGEPVIEQLQREGLPVRGFMTTNASKTRAVEGLALAFERDEIRIPNDPVLIGELQAFEGRQLAGGKMRYEAPAGMHDDTVMSLAIAWDAITTAMRVLW